MMLLRQSNSHRPLQPGSFFWATGIEDTFITAPWPKTGRTLDEYELTRHYERVTDDLALMAEIGVGAARYGIPWHRVQPRRDAWDWNFVDRALDRLLALNIEPIVDLVHYGLPPWIEGAYLNPDFPRFMADYAARVAERFRGRVFAYTPLNEPRITAWYCGRLGWWPPFQRGWRGFVAVMLAAARGIVESVHALRAVDPEILIAHVDATDLYRTADPALAAEASHRQEIVFLALDLISGRVGETHALHGWLLAHGAHDRDLAWFADHAVDLPLIGLNLYPMFTHKVARPKARGGIRWTMPYATAEIIDALGTMYHERYGAPLFISETASVGTVKRRAAWLEDSIAAVRRLREKGVPMIGYTWWPLFALVTWAYRQGTHPPEFYLKQMGLWNLGSDLARMPTTLVDQFRALTAQGAASVGALPSQPAAISAALPSP